IRDDALFDTFSPHSDQFTVRERIRFASPGVLEDQITDMDPKALVEPFHSVRTYRKAAPPNDELREFSCAEGLGATKWQPPGVCSHCCSAWRAGAVDPSPAAPSSPRRPPSRI